MRYIIYNQYLLLKTYVIIILFRYIINFYFYNIYNKLNGFCKGERSLCNSYFDNTNSEISNKLKKIKLKRGVINTLITRTLYLHSKYLKLRRYNLEYRI